MHSFERIKNGVKFGAFWAIPSVHLYSVYSLASTDSQQVLWFSLFTTLPLIALLIWLFRLKGQSYIRVKSLWERPLSLFLLVLCSPPLLITAFLIKLESPGPAVYDQVRIGMNSRKRKRTDQKDSPAPIGRLERRKHDLGGRPFVIYKLRSMTQNAEEQTGAAWSTGDHDPRITSIGYYIRKTHLDELPQLYNVLRAEMSLIGPRPERPDFIVRLANLIDGYRARLAVPPGMTGLSQVRKEHDQSLEDVKDKLKNDLEYIEKVCLSLDIVIILRTVLLMINLFWSAVRRRTIEKIEAKPMDVVFADNPPNKQ